MSIAENLWNAQHAFSRLEDDLDGLVAPHEFERITHDYYDASLELKGASDGLRLDDRALGLIWKSGFCKVYVNHTDGWQTHYNKGGDSKGWRRRYVSDPSSKTTNVISGPDNNGYYEISHWPDGWGSEEEDKHGWLKSGYMRIVGDKEE